MGSLFEMFELKQGKVVNTKSLKDGNVKIISNGSKQYKKDIESNLNDECIIITKMSIDVIFISKEECKDYYISSGTFILTLKEDYKKGVLLKYLFYCFQAFGIIDLLKSKRHGSLQQAINKNDLQNVLKICKT